MKVTYASPKVAVVDDFLEAEGLARLWEYAQAETYELVHGPEWFKTYRPLDGVAFEGPPYLSVGGEPGRTYPTGRAIDLLLARLDRCAAAFDEQIGTRGEAWRLFTARAFLYRTGSGLTWHSDVDRDLTRARAYAYYAHPVWRSTWGGELLLADGEPSSDVSWLSPGDDSPGLADGRYFMPRPNRLIVLRSGCWHSIRAIHPPRLDCRVLPEVRPPPSSILPDAPPIKTGNERETRSRK